MITSKPTENSSEFHKKGWGHELWIVNCEKYCGKILHFEEGKKCSWHYHKVKHETFYLQSGKLLIKYGDDDDIDASLSRVLMPGESMIIYPGLRHQMIALEDSDLLEFSTQHFENDSYRVVKGD
jgi:quercetin dioxygenase-like cupin family protein